MSARDPKKMKREKRRLILIDPYCFYCRRQLYHDCPVAGRVPNQRYCTIDHLLPVDQGGTDDPLNLVLCCTACNGSKGNRTPEEWAAMIRRAAEQLQERVDSVRFWTFGQAAKPAGVAECY